MIQVSLHLLTLFLIRQPITEYGRVFVERETIVGDGRETLWLRTVVLNRVDIDGNPNIRQNGGIRGLADVHSSVNLAVGICRYVKKWVLYL